MSSDSHNLEYGLGLGSNRGDRLANLRHARERIRRIEGVRILAASPVYETDPVDVSPAFRDSLFLNACLVVDYPGEPIELARRLHAIEDAMGRRRTADRNAPRVIDIDLLYAGDTLLESGELSLPHPRWHARRFVVKPLADIRPDLRLPGSTRTLRELDRALPDSPSVHRHAENW